MQFEAASLVLKIMILQPIFHSEKDVPDLSHFKPFQTIFNFMFSPFEMVIFLLFYLLKSL